MSRQAVKFRPAGIDDYPAICRLFTSAEELFRVFPGGSWPFNLRQLHRIAEKRSDLTVATDAGKVVGFANLYGLLPRKRAFIGNVIVKASHRGQGTGRALVKYMLDRIFTYHELPLARIAVFEDNKPAFALYRQLGFKIVDRDTRQDPDGRKVVLLQMQLVRSP
ncbi:MAG: GNAT family N-acetyltransferase [Thiogranum sp.]